MTWKCGCGGQWDDNRLHCPHCGYDRVAGGGETWQCTGCWLWNSSDRGYCENCGRPQGATPMQAYFLTRLRRMRQKRQWYADDSHLNPYALAMLDKAIFSTLQDCQMLGVGSQAKVLLEGEKK